METAQSAPTEQEQSRFRTREAARRWVVDQGVRCSKDRFYKACNLGQVRVYPDKTVSRSSVLEYVLKLKDTAPAANLDLVDYSQERQRLEVEKLSLEVEKLKIATRASDRDWVHIDDHWAHMAATLALCKGNLEHYARIAASEVVAISGGDYYHLAPQVSDTIMELVVARAFNDLAVQRIDAGRFSEHEEQQGEQDGRE